MKTFAGFVAGGAIALVVLKILAALLLPILGSFLALVMTGVKLVVLAAVVYVAYSWLLKRRKEGVSG